MFKQLKNYLFAAIMLATICCLTAARPAQPSVQTEQARVSELTVTATSSTSVSLSWSASSFTGTGDNTVTVTNLTLSQMEQQFTTSSTSTSVSSLRTGHTYRFEVSKNGYVIAEEIVL